MSPLPNDQQPSQNPQSPMSSEPSLQDEPNAQEELPAKVPTSPRPFIIYPREQLLRLSYSTLVGPPPNMPELKNWFGIENENLAKKDEVIPSGTTRERRYRRDAEDGEASARPSFRSTLSQPSQMGNFKHQSLRPSDRDRERDRDRDGERDRERDIREKEGQERLRHLSDKYDRDKLASPLSNSRTKERDTVPHIGVGNQRSQALPSNAASRRSEAREAAKKKVGEASEDWRRGAEPTRSSRDERSENGRREREDRERARSRGRDTSRSKREGSATRRDKDREDHRGGRGDRESNDHRRDVETEDDPRRWRDDGKREERLAARRADRERARNGHDHGWEGTSDRRWDERDGRYKRSGARDRKSANNLEDGKEKEERREKERDKEKEPAWMDTYIPTETSSGILGAQGLSGELDGIQAWKKGLKDKENKAKEAVLDSDPKPSSAHTVTLGEPPLDEIQMFKLMMKREEEKKKIEALDNLSVVQSAKENTVVDISQGRQRNSTEGINQKQQPDPQTLNETASPSHVGQITLGPGLSKDPQTSPLGKIDQLGTTSAVVESTQDRAISPFAQPNTSESQAVSTQPSGELSRPSFHPVTGSRVLAFAKVPPKATTPGVPSSHTQTTPAGLQNIPFEAPQSIPPHPHDNLRPGSGFSPFDEQNRQSYAFDDSRDPGVSVNLGYLHNQANNSNAEVLHNGFVAQKGSRFAKFFDGKTRDGLPPSIKSQGPVGYLSSSPNHNQRQDPFNGLSEGLNDNRGLDDIFAMLNNSQRVSLGQHGVGGPLVGNSGHYGAQGQNMHSVPQHHLQPPMNNRLESLYDSRGDDRFVPDGMVPGLRPIPPPPRNPPDSIEDSMQYNLQRLNQQQSRNIDSLYSGPLPPMYAQHGRHHGLPLPALQQAQYRGGPSPSMNQSAPLGNNQQHQRLPPGLANLGGRPPHEPNQFLGLPGLPAGGPPINTLGNGPIPQQLPFNNYNVGFNGSQIRGSIPSIQNIGPQHSLNNLGLHPNLDPRLNHPQLLGLGGSRLNGAFAQLSNTASAHLNMRPQQQIQQQSLHQMLPPLIPPHLQQQSHPTPNPQSNDLMTILMGGTHRE